MAGASIRQRFQATWTVLTPCRVCWKSTLPASQLSRRMLRTCDCEPVARQCSAEQSYSVHCVLCVLCTYIPDLSCPFPVGNRFPVKEHTTWSASSASLVLTSPGRVWQKDRRSPVTLLSMFYPDPVPDPMLGGGGQRCPRLER